MKKSATKKSVRSSALSHRSVKPVQKKSAANKALNVKSPTTGLTFGDALAKAKNEGAKIARNGWNGKGMFVIWVPGSKVTLQEGTPYAKVFPRRKQIQIDGHFDMFTANKTMQPGWLASQADMAASDWAIVK